MKTLLDVALKLFQLVDQCDHCANVLDNNEYAEIIHILQNKTQKGDIPVFND